jgi:hypothetical protein
MRVQLLYFDGCPNYLTTITLLREVLSAGGSAEEIELVEVGTPEAAERWQFRGSPTILIDGKDPFLDEDAPVGLSCRIYLTPDGLAGSPTASQLSSALEGLL